MEPENIDWDNIDSTFVKDDTYENFDAPMWVDLSAFHDSLVNDEAWFCTRDCNHPKIAEDFLKPATRLNSKVKLLRFASFSEILPFRDRNKRENSSTVESCYEGNESSEKSSTVSSEKSSGNLYEDNENRNPNFTAPLPNGRTNNLKKPLIKTNKANPEQLNDPVECGVKSQRKSKLKSTFSAQNLLGGREILSQISGLCSELKRLARGKKGTNEKGASHQSEVSEVKESVVLKERVPLLVVKDSRK